MSMAAVAVPSATAHCADSPASDSYCRAQWSVVNPPKCTGCQCAGKRGSDLFWWAPSQICQRDESGDPALGGIHGVGQSTGRAVVPAGWIRESCAVCASYRIGRRAFPRRHIGLRKGSTDGTQYCAGPGYDLVTGLGSPTAALIDALLPKLQGLLTKSCAFSLTSYEYTEDQVTGKQLGGNNAVFKGAIVVIVDGFAPSDLQIGDSSSLSKAPIVTFTPSMGLTNPATCSSLVSSDPSFGSEKQQFRFSYDLDFGSNLAAFTSISKTVAISTTYQGLTASTALTLLQGTGRRTCASRCCRITKRCMQRKHTRRVVRILLGQA